MLSYPFVPHKSTTYDENSYRKLYRGVDTLSEAQSLAELYCRYIVADRFRLFY